MVIRCFVDVVTVSINGRVRRNADVTVEPDMDGNGTARFTFVPLEEGTGEIRVCTVTKNAGGIPRGRVLLQVGPVRELPTESLFDPDHATDEVLIDDDVVENELGPSGPKEIIMADDFGDPPKKSPWVVFLGIVTALGIVFGIAVWRMPPTIEETVSPEPVAVTPPPAEPVTPVAVSEPQPPPDPVIPPAPEPVPEPAAAEVVPTPVAAAPPPPAPVAVEPAKVDPPKVAVAPPPAPKPAPTPTAVPSSLVVSAMGANPRCVADCAWGNLADNGFPKTVDGTRTVVCSDGNTWLAAVSTKIESGAHAKCYTVSGISAP